MTVMHTDIDNRNFKKFFIDGEWVLPSTQDSLQVISPVSEEVVFEVAEAAEADVDAAVNAARKAFDTGPWPSFSPAKRAEYLEKLVELLHSRTEELGAVWGAEIGVLDSLKSRAIPVGIAPIEREIKNAEQFEFIQKRPSAAAKGAYLAYEPVGVVACIAPWNAPLITMCNKIGPALLAGCCVIMKPAPQTPIEAIIIAECAEKAGFPEGVVNMLTADRDVSDYLARHEGVDKVSFTGSLGAGQRIASVCGQRVARVTLELGGKSAAIVLDDYDLETAATGLSQAICVLAGQNCAALSRILVSRDRHDELVELLSEKLDDIVIGDPTSMETQLGPLAMERQLKQVEKWVAKAIDEGATLVRGGKRPEHLTKGYYYEPTLFSNVDNSMSIAQAEVFGPVLCVIPFDSEDEAVRIANDSQFGLAGTVYTIDTDKAYKFARKIRTGTIAQNGPFVDFSIAFGGFKKSGLGREGGIEGLKSYLELKTILLSEEPNSI